ncbi:hypothetical protein BN874_1480003 [Candidatus Contendobacter odensis Run_B_J11]|uniref:Uncharacterized protein n=2 Tax=Candidatus Contendibacter odensensis TaxID=1400860 RepID=A0A7U7G9J5_9GAMM|nr:hypothetical protein BN874_1480003 [Candidatus Contendobacter odensis Run_B_J11]
MKSHEVNRFLSRQNPHQVRQLLDKWQTRAATDPHFRKEFPNPNLYAAAQLEQGKKSRQLIDDWAARAPIDPEFCKEFSNPSLYIKHCETQAACGIAV